jgi:hypothetical protein
MQRYKKVVSKKKPVKFGGNLTGLINIRFLTTGKQRGSLSCRDGYTGGW